MTLFAFWAAHRQELLVLLGQHVLLVGLSTGIAVAVGVPLGIVAARRPPVGRPLIAIANVAQSIPSLAMLGFLIPVPLIGGVGARAAIVVLILYALLPVIRLTAAGITGIDRHIVEAGLAMGMRPGQLLRLVELPLALPSMVAGVRVATITNIGTATVAAAIGAGGLGEYIFRGLSMVDATVILAGAVPAAALALTADGLLTWLERRLSSFGGRTRRGTRVATAAAAALAAGALLWWGASAAARDRVVVGSKNFTEQVVLGELVAQVLEGAGVRVDRRLNLGGTLVCDRALRAGGIDVYVEYTGTALTAIFNRPMTARRRADVFEQVRRDYAETGRTLLPPLGFDNTFAILVRRRDAEQYGLERISDLTRVPAGWRPGFGYEFVERPDGYPGLARSYGLVLAPPRVMDLSLSYRALASGEVDVIAGDATSGLIDALDLRRLADDRAYFPPYDAVPVVRTATFLRVGRLRAALARLSGLVTEADMRRLNRLVDVDRMAVPGVVRAFLAESVDRRVDVRGRVS